MNWHYAINGESRGPVGDDEFQRLVQQGVITRETLVWRDGMANWVPYGQNVSNLAPLPAGEVVCAMCGRRISRNDAFILSGVSYCAACKPLVVQRLKEGVGIGNSAVEEMRKSHIKHEASIKSIGVLYYLGGVAVLLIGFASVTGPSSAGNMAEALGAGTFSVVLGAAQFWVGTGIRALRSWARIPTGILSGIGLLAFPLGTIINAYILYLIFSKKGATVFSPEYQEVIRQTPHIKYRTSIVVWILLGIVVAIVIGVFTLAFFHGGPLKTR